MDDLTKSYLLVMVLATDADLVKVDVEVENQDDQLTT